MNMKDMERKMKRYYAEAKSEILTRVVVSCTVTFAYCVGLAMGRIIEKSSLSTKEGTMKETTIEETKEIANPNEYKIYQPEEHYFSIKLRSKDCDPKVLDDLNIPEGYMVYSLVPYTTEKEDKIIDEGFKVVFINREPVVVYPTYNSNTGNHEYKTAGYVINIENPKQLTK